MDELADRIGIPIKSAIDDGTRQALRQVELAAPVRTALAELGDMISTPVRTALAELAKIHKVS